MDSRRLNSGRRNRITASTATFRCISGIEACHPVEAALSSKSLVTVPQDSQFVESITDRSTDRSVESFHRQGNATDSTTAFQKPRSVHLRQERVSPWARSQAKRLFDCSCILPLAPVLIPVFLLIGLAVRLTSSGPVLFLQKRMGCHGRVFTIVKFRTLTHCSIAEHHAVTTAANQRFTPIGRFLRKWKLDELPQLWNVLIGDMSLVGARPKLPIHQLGELRSRPGITGRCHNRLRARRGHSRSVARRQLERLLQ